MHSRGYNSRRSWVVAFACSVIGFLIVLPIKIAGLFFIIIIERYENNRMYASIPLMMFGIIRTVTGPFTGFLGQVFGLRNVTLMGCFLVSIGIGACFFAEDITGIIIFLGLIYGIGNGLGMTLVPEILKQHFSKDLNLVNGMFITGSCLGAIVMPPLIELLIKEYGYSGMFLLLGGILLHSLPFAILLNDPKNKQYHVRIRNSKICDSEITKSLEIIQSGESAGTFSKNGNTERAVEDNNISKNYKCGNEVDDSVDSELIFQSSEKENKIIEQVQIIKESETKGLNTDSKPLDLCNSHRISSYGISNIKCTNVSNIKCNHVSYNDSELEIIKRNREIESHQTFPEISETRKSDTKHKLVLLFLDPTFHLTMIIQSSLAFIVTLNWTILIDFVRDKGISPSESLHFLIMMPFSEIFGSLSLNWISDRGFMTRTKYCVVCHLILSGTSICMVFAHSYALMMAVVFMFSILAMSLHATFPGMIHEFIEEDLQGLALASRFVLYGFLCFTKSPIIGYFRGTLGSYDWVYVIIAMSCVMGAVLTAFTPVLTARRKNKKMKMDIELKS